MTVTGAFLTSSSAWAAVAVRVAAAPVLGAKLLPLIVGVIVICALSNVW